MALKYWSEDEIGIAVGLGAILVVLYVVNYCVRDSRSDEAKRQEIEFEESIKRKRLTNGYKCPSCGAMAGHEIGKIDKGLSVGTLGLLSNKVGKTYQCESCKYMW